MEFGRDAAVQIRVSPAKNNSHRPPKLFELESHFGARSYGWQQILVQPEEGWSCAGLAIELLIQQWHKLISNLRIPEESAYLPPVHATENKVIEQPRNEPRNIPNERRREKKNRFGRSEARHCAIVGIQENQSCCL